MSPYTYNTSSLDIDLIRGEQQNRSSLDRIAALDANQAWTGKSVEFTLILNRNTDFGNEHRRHRPAIRGGQDMLHTKLAGPGAAARKYDVITALGSYALSLGKHEQRLILRLITLLTARYNWARNELSIGQREIGQLWSCTERTVKRELAKLRALGWLIVKRQGSRGRVTTYSFDSGAALQSTRDVWPNIGPDFVVRLEGPPAAETIVPFPVKGTAPPPIDEATEWGLARAVLYAEDQGCFGVWIQSLTRTGRAGGRITLKAPSRFHAAYVQTHLTGRLLRACQSVDAEVSTIEITD